ncbi:hypothetical protein ACHAW5_001491 [Stephanodiscus triporus]|uniref:DHHA2 domain-containing protein n=1 Tax=Stephanodiscus triporus TaxID=2934178 RepID=A0ABD3N2Y3_9STRA
MRHRRPRPSSVDGTTTGAGGGTTPFPSPPPLARPAAAVVTARGAIAIIIIIPCLLLLANDARTTTTVAAAALLLGRRRPFLGVGRAPPPSSSVGSNFPRPPPSTCGPSSSSFVDVVVARRSFLDDSNGRVVRVPAFVGRMTSSPEVEEEDAPPPPPPPPPLLATTTTMIDARDDDDDDHDDHDDHDDVMNVVDGGLASYLRLASSALSKATTTERHRATVAATAAATATATRDHDRDHDDDHGRHPTPPRKIVHLILGNEAGDADSIASAIGLGYVLSTTKIADRRRRLPPPPRDDRDMATAGGEGKGEGKEGTTSVVDFVVPIVSVPRADVYLRPDVVLLLDLAGIKIEDLVCVDDDVARCLLSSSSSSSSSAPPASSSSSSPPPPPARDATTMIRLTLVDHNRIRSSLDHLSSSVVEILDHHEDEGYHEYVTYESGDRIVAYANGVADLLRRTDWSALPSFDDGDTTTTTTTAARRRRRRRRRASDLVERVFPNGRGNAPDPTALFDALSYAKFDPKFWSTLSVSDCLRIDHKRFAVDSSPSSSSSSSSRVSSIGLSSVLAGMDFMLAREDFRRDLASFMLSSSSSSSSSSSDLYGMLTLEFREDGAPERGLLLACADASIVDSFADYFLEIVERGGMGGIGASAEDGDGRVGSEDATIAIRVFRQGNGKGSRKQVAPVLLRHAMRGPRL